MDREFSEAIQRMVEDTDYVTPPDSRVPRYIFHTSFCSPEAGELYPALSVLNSHTGREPGFLKDAGKTILKRMNYHFHLAAHAKSDEALRPHLRDAQELRNVFLIGCLGVVRMAMKGTSLEWEGWHEAVGVCIEALMRHLEYINPWSPYGLLGMIIRQMRTFHRKCLGKGDLLVRSCDPTEFGPIRDHSCHDNRSDDEWDLVARYFEADDTLLTDREKECVKSYFGLFGQFPRHTKDIAIEHGVCKQRVHAVIRKALFKIRCVATGRAIPAGKECDRQSAEILITCAGRFRYRDPKVGSTPEMLTNLD